MIPRTLLLICLFVPISLVLLHSTSLASDMNAAILANPCAGCHGPDGKSPGAIPSLNILSSKYIVLSMKAFKTEQRKGTVMNRIAKGYSDREIEIMAQYFEKNK